MPGENRSDEQKKRPVGRPPKYRMPEPIPDSPDNVGSILMSTPPPEWTYEDTD